MTVAKPSILLVDDVEANLIALDAVLSTMDCDLVRARSGDDALKELLRGEFAAMLLDAHMPQMDGFEVARYARRNRATRDVPIIFLTALPPTEESALRGYGSGAVDFLFKPVNPTILRSKVQVFLDLYNARQRLIEAQAQEIELEAARRVAESRKALLDELTRKNAALARANVELEQFAYIASHDLREPLRMVGTYTELIGETYGNELDDDGRRYIRFAREGARRMQQLIDDLLLYTRVRHENVTPASVDMNQLVDEVTSQLQVTIDEANGTVAHGALPIVLGSHSQLGQVIQNLVSNAMKFRGADPPRVEIQSHDAGEEWGFTVRDNGIGMDPAFAERAFQIFQRYYARDEYPGTGLGLTIARGIVHRHGGRIWVESNLDEGATFHFTLPKERGPSQ